MKRMCNMRMREYCCCDMMAMTMKEGIYIVGINKVKKKQYEKISSATFGLSRILPTRAVCAM